MLIHENKLKWRRLDENYMQFRLIGSYGDFKGDKTCLLILISRRKGKKSEKRRV
jgi:hypothetical protein